MLKCTRDSEIHDQKTSSDHKIKNQCSVYEWKMSQKLFAYYYIQLIDHFYSWHIHSEECINISPPSSIDRLVNKLCSQFFCKVCLAETLHTLIAAHK